MSFPLMHGRLASLAASIPDDSAQAFRDAFQCGLVDEGMSLTEVRAVCDTVYGVLAAEEAARKAYWEPRGYRKSCCDDAFLPIVCDQCQDAPTTHWSIYYGYEYPTRAEARGWTRRGDEPRPGVAKEHGG